MMIYQAKKCLPKQKYAISSNFKTIKYNNGWISYSTVAQLCSLQINSAGGIIQNFEN